MKHPYHYTNLHLYYIPSFVYSSSQILLFLICSVAFLFPDGLFSWSRAVQIRTNLDLVLDWLQGAGLGDIASEFLKKLSNTVNFLCVPKTRLIQVTH